MSTILEHPFLRYFREAFKEIRKVSWPSRDQLVKSTLTVIVFSVVFAAFLGLVDYLLNQALQLVI